MARSDGVLMSSMNGGWGCLEKLELVGRVLERWVEISFGVSGGLSRRDLSDFVPEGLNDRSQAIYCLECVRKRSVP
jgi:hypothetical protein